MKVVKNVSNGSAMTVDLWSFIKRDNFNLWECVYSQYDYMALQISQTELVLFERHIVFNLSSVLFDSSVICNDHIADHACLLPDCKTHLFCVLVSK